MIKTNKIKNIIEYMVALYIILESNSMYNFINEVDFNILKGLMFFIIILSIFNALIYKDCLKKISKGFVFLIFYVLCAFLFFMLNVIDNDKSSFFIVKYIIFFPLIYLYYISGDENNNIKSILKKIVNIMCALAILSLFFYVFGSILNIIKPSNYITAKWAFRNKVATYYYLHFNTQSTNFFGINIERNTGIFPEAPMFSINLCIAIAIILFILDKKVNRKVILLSITIFTTFSATGIAMTIIMTIIFFITNKKLKKTYFKYIFLPIILIIGIIVCICLMEMKSDTISSAYRWNDYIISFEAWKEHPIIGIGYDNATKLMTNYGKFAKYSINYSTLSSSIMPIIAQCGIFMISLYIMSAINAIKKIRKKEIIIFVCIIIILLALTIFSYTSMLINLVAMGYAICREDEKKSEI